MTVGSSRFSATMKFAFTAIFLAISLQVAVGQQKQLAQVQRECADKSKVDQNVLQKTRIGDYANDEKLKEYLLCMAQKIGFQTDSGSLQRQVILTKLKAALQGDDARARELVRQCIVSNTDPKLQAFNTFKCVYQKAKINYL
ncbi:B1 protein-like [Euwallacea fornicatus]|uniref:B1 protein-like n=1 Tax=Euwallacea fornicatus TaxID=995702 RepID=UPI00338F0F4E